MNQKLFDLYNSKWKFLNDHLNPIIKGNYLIKPTNPLLIRVNNEDAYDSADIRVMIFGQETNNWEGLFGKSIDELLTVYHTFYNQGGCWTYSGQFWNGVKRFKELFQNHFENKKVEFIWNNIVKIGKYAERGFPPNYIYQIEKDYFSIITGEINILKPDIILFFTGPNYDAIIKNNFKDINFQGVPTFSQRQLSQITHNGNTKFYRTYHPNYLWRNNINRYYETIVKNLLIKV